MTPLQTQSTTAAARAALAARALHMYAREYYGAHNSVVWRKICSILGGPERTGLDGWSPLTQTTIQVTVNASHCARDVVTNARFTGYFTPTIDDDVGDEAEAEALAYLRGV